MQLTTYGYKLPEAGDLSKGTTGWFKMFEYDISRLDAHVHDGISSALIPPSSFSPYSQTITVGATGGVCTAWVADGLGYKKTITVPAGVAEINDYNVKLIFTAPAAVVGYTGHLGMKRITATTYELYCNDNTASFTATYR